MKIGILVHGVHLQAKGWENIVWGKTPDMMGRIPKAMQMYFRFGASVMYFGTGASEKDGIREGQYIFNTLLNQKKQLQDFNTLKDIKNLDKLEVQSTPANSILYGGNQTEVIIDTTSQTTREELLAAGNAFLERGITEVVLVSSASHLPRCMRDAQVIFNDPKYNGKYKTLAQNIIAAPADTCFDGASYDSTVIFETPHRADQLLYPLNEKAKLLFRVKPQNLEEFGKLLEELVSRYV